MLEQRDIITQKVSEASEESFLILASKFHDKPEKALKVLKELPGKWAICIDGLFFRYLTKTANDNLLSDLRAITAHLKDISGKSLIDSKVAYEYMYRITQKYGYPILSGEVGLSASLNTKWARLLVEFSPSGFIESVELIEYNYWH